MSVKARGDKIQIQFYYKGVRCRETLNLPPTKKNMKHAEGMDAKIAYDIGLGHFVFRDYFPDSNTRSANLFGNAKAGNTTVEKALMDYYVSKAPKDGANNERAWKVSTAKTNLQAIEGQLVPFFKDVRLVDLNVQKVREFIRSQTCGNKRVNNILIPLRGMIKEAYEHELIPVNPMDIISNLPIITREPLPFSTQEQRTILASFPDQLRNYLQFAIFTGLRTGELIALRWTDIDWAKGGVHVRRNFTNGVITTPKTAAGVRSVDLFKPALQALEAQKEYTYENADRVFHNPHTNKPWSGDGAVWKYWNPIMKALEKSHNISYREPYQTRHTYASMMLSAGEHPVWLARQLGHTDPSVLYKKYARWMPDMYPHAGEKIKEAWSLCGHGVFL